MKENSIEEDIKIALDKFSDNRDIDSAMLIVEKFILGNYILLGGNRGNIVKDSLRYLLSDYKRVLKENEELKSKIENKDKYFDLITGLGYDYDGYYNKETSNGNIKGLADLIDELVQAARDGLNDIPYQK